MLMQSEELSFRYQLNKKGKILYCQMSFTQKNLEKILLSVAKLTDSGAEVRFFDNKAEVCKEGELLLEAKKKDGLYVLQAFSRNFKESESICYRGESERIKRRRHKFFPGMLVGRSSRILFQ